MKYRLVLLLSIPILFLFGFFYVEGNIPSSVEVGLSETSPLGSVGGYAAPASGCSDGPHPDPGDPICGSTIFLVAQVDPDIIIRGGTPLNAVAGRVRNDGTKKVNYHTFSIAIDGLLVGSGRNNADIEGGKDMVVSNYPIGWVAPRVSVVTRVPINFCVDHPHNSSKKSNYCDKETIKILPFDLRKPKITANGKNKHVIVRKGSDVLIEWDHGGHFGCVLNKKLESDPYIMDSKIVRQNAETTYTIICDDGAKDSVSVSVVPVLFEE